MKSALLVKRRLRSYATEKRAIGAARYFKTGKGEYGEGDRFIGVTVPDVRKVARQFRDLDFDLIEKLLQSKIHEERLLALLILVRRYAANPDQVFQLYMRNLIHVNNWDLVDLSAPGISGAYLFAKPGNRKMLMTLAKSPRLWERRVAMLSTFYFIREKSYREPLKIAKMLLRDPHDLIHKAVGWMLRELGKRGDKRVLDAFLKQYAPVMPRTMLRYAIEHHSTAEKKRWMSMYRKPATSK